MDHSKLVERQNFANRLRMALKKQGLDDCRPQTVAKLFGVSYTALHKWLNAKSMPNQARMNQIASVLKVSPAWLSFGQTQNDNLDPLDDLILENLQKLNIEQKEALLNLIKTL